jgi:hypothetical protein
MSSLASVLVANAKATPEKVVPCQTLSQYVCGTIDGATYEVYANNQLSLASARALDLSSSAGPLV